MEDIWGFFLAGDKHVFVNNNKMYTFDEVCDAYPNMINVFTKMFRENTEKRDVEEIQKFIRKFKLKRSGNPLQQLKNLKIVVKNIIEQTNLVDEDIVSKHTKTERGFIDASVYNCLVDKVGCEESITECISEICTCLGIDINTANIVYQPFESGESARLVDFKKVLVTHIGYKTGYISVTFLKKLLNSKKNKQFFKKFCVLDEGNFDLLYPDFNVMKINDNIDFTYNLPNINNIDFNDFIIEKYHSFNVDEFPEECVFNDFDEFNEDDFEDDFYEEFDDEYDDEEFECCDSESDLDGNEFQEFLLEYFFGNCENSQHFNYKNKNTWKDFHVIRLENFEDSNKENNTNFNNGNDFIL